MQARHAHAQHDNRRLGDALRLYSVEPPLYQPVGASPPLRLDLIEAIDLEGVLAVRNIFFPQPQPKKQKQEPLGEVRITWSGAYIELPDGLVPVVLRGASELVAIVPGFNEWMREWAASAQRIAQIDPPWAASRGIGPGCVGRIAEAVVRDLAKSSPRMISLMDAAGQEATLLVPARAQLIAPGPVVPETKELFAVAGRR